MPAQNFLRIANEHRELLRVPIDKSEITIGGHVDNDVVLPDPELADRVAYLHFTEAGTCQLICLSENDDDVHINGQTVHPAGQNMHAGDRLQIGAFHLQILQSQAETIKPRKTNVLAAPVEDLAAAELCVADKILPISAQQTFNIGCHSDNDLVLNDDYCSGYHCRFVVKNNRWNIVDLGSTNGTFVDGHRVQETELLSRAKIRVGQTELIFRLKSPAANIAEETIHFEGLISQSPKMRQVFELVARYAKNREPVLLIGESGTGKELLARALHNRGTKASAPFLALNCGALAGSIIESELFGYEKNAFTGATTDKAGAFEATSGGTLFLDEIGELSLELQPKLLRVLETKSIRRVGGTKEIPISTRVIAATHRNLDELVQKGLFREDLFHRLFVLTLRIPPLRERPEDILALAQNYLNQAERPLSLSPSAISSLRNYIWPGNVRELRNVLIRAAVSTDHDTIESQDLVFAENIFGRAQAAQPTTANLQPNLAPQPAAHAMPPSAPPATNAAQPTTQPYGRLTPEQERARLLELLQQTRGNRAEAARLMGMSKSTFHDRLRRYGIPLKFESSSF